MPFTPFGLGLFWPVFLVGRNSVFRVARGGKSVGLVGAVIGGERAEQRALASQIALGPDTRVPGSEEV